MTETHIEHGSRKPQLGFWQIWNMSFGFLGIQIGFGLQGANMSRIFETLGASLDTLPLLWLAGPITGLLVQPLVGYFSDRTWTRFGRRRPYFLMGALIASLALFWMPNSPYLWMAAALLWILDAAINVSMEPFRAFVGDMLPAEQRTKGYAMQGIFIGTGAVLASIAPWVFANWLGVSNEAPEGVLPMSVKLSFYVGAVVFFLAVMWTVFRTKEYAPEVLKAYEVEETARLGLVKEVSKTLVKPSFFKTWGLALTVIGMALVGAVYGLKGERQLYIFGGGLAALGAAFLWNSLRPEGQAPSGALGRILDDLVTMPLVMRRLAIVQFFSWFALFIMWIYTTSAVTTEYFGATGPKTPGYEDGANWVGIMFAVYNGVAAIYAFLIPRIVKALGLCKAHAFGLLMGALGIGSVFVFKTPNMLALSMVGVGIAWASILTLPYAILSDVLPAEKMGLYMGIFNFFIVIPQIVVAGIIGIILKSVFDNQAIYLMLIAGAVYVIAAICMAFVPYKQAHQI